MFATTTMFQDTRRKKKDDRYPVKLRITHNRVSQYFPTGYDLSEEEFQRLSSPRLGKDLMEIRAKLLETETKAQNIIKIVKPFRFTTFKKKFYQGEVDFSGNGKFTQLFLEYIEQLEREERMGTASNYRVAYRSLTNFQKHIEFHDLTKPFLLEYEKWMLAKGCSISTVGIYLRPLRTIVNEAIAQGIMTREEYPFGRRQYQIPASRNIKKALSLADIGKIYYYEPESRFDGEAMAKDMWLFCYFANGINFKDIALLKYKNIRGEYISFERAKTQRSTRGNSKPISCFISEDMQQIINRWGNLSRKPENYIFPVLEPNCTAERQHKLTLQFVKTTNKWISRIGEKVGIEQRVTTYVARHSFSTVLKRSGASIEFISEALGHADVRTTENYLDSFEDETKKHFAATLSAFKRPEGQL